MTETNVRSTFHIPYPNPQNRYRLDPGGNPRFPFGLAFTGLLFYLLVSDNLLVSIGIPYNTPTGSFLFKLHPGTYLIGLGFLVLVFQGHPRQRWAQLFAAATAPLLLAGTIVGVLVYTLIRFGPSGNAFFIDTLLTPALLAAILLEAPLKWRRLLFRTIIGLLVLNALLGIGEALTERRLTPYLAGDQPIIEDFFRATALGGHPLTNALRTATLLMACLILPRGWLLFLIPLLVIALLAFGGRTALVMSVVLLIIWGAYYFFRGIIRRTFDVRLVFSLIFMTFLVAGSIVALTFSLELGERIFQNLSWDTSAQSRILIFRAFDYLSLQDWLWGIGPARIDVLLDRLKASTVLTDFENFWVLLLMQVGLAWFVLIAVTLLGMIASLVWRAPPALKLAAMIFLVIASTNNSLATKSQSLAILVAILIGGAAEAALATPPHSWRPPIRLGSAMHQNRHA